MQKFMGSAALGKLFVERKSLELAVAAPDEGAITKEERLAVMEARRLKLDLLELVRTGAEVSRVETLATSLGELGEGRLLELQRIRASATHLKNYSVFLNRLWKGFGRERAVDSITVAECATWLHSQGWGPVSVAHFRTYLVSLWNFGKTQGLCTTNPAQTVRLPKIDYAPVSILSPTQCSQLLGACCERILPAIAIALFAGLRPDSELRRLRWEHVLWDRGLIEVVGKNTRGAARRLVTIQPVLRKWLGPFVQKEGEVCPAKMTMRRLFLAAKSAAGWGPQEGKVPWPQDVLRHSFASYHLAHFGDAGRTAGELGHSSTKKLFSNYREVVSPEEAREFWGLRPVGCKIIYD